MEITSTNRAWPTAWTGNGGERECVSCPTRLLLAWCESRGLFEAIYESLLVREPFLAEDGRVIAQNSHGLDKKYEQEYAELSWLTA